MTLLLWLLSLAALSVGARNFEQGISIDGPLYASIARNIARTGEWFRLDAGTPDFTPFAEHPHLGFWLQALIFKVLPIDDWSARLQGHIFYVLALALVYKITERFYSARAAVFAVLMLWSMSVFSNYFSNFYLDPGCLVFGTLFLVAYSRALSRRSLSWTLVAGGLLSLAFLQKGLTGL
ncbi:MAG: glycosyltransferase family 39 protein, partial [Bdellovibrionota bacterium]